MLILVVQCAFRLPSAPLPVLFLPFLSALLVSLCASLSRFLCAGVHRNFEGVALHGAMLGCGFSGGSSLVNLESALLST